MTMIAGIMPAKSWIPGAIPPSKPTFFWLTGLWAAPPFLPAHPPASTKPSNCAIGDNARYLGKGTLKAVKNINKKIRPRLGAWRPGPGEIDGTMIELDGTPNKGQLGANAILAVSMAAARAARTIADDAALSLSGGVGANLCPFRMMNILNGGAHADNSVDFQEFMICPYGARHFREALRMGAEVFHTLKSVLKKRGYSTSVGDEGGFAPILKSNEEAIEVVLEAITRPATSRASRSASRSIPPPANSTIRRQVCFQEVRQMPRAPMKW